MPATDLLGVPSITGGAAGPSSALSYGGITTLTMNSPFSFAANGGKANATSENGGTIDPQVLILMAIVGGIVLIFLK
ncbi:MAG: hypothetical protein AAB276_06600 [Pseudomonadota bacterium]